MIWWKTGVKMFPFRCNTSEALTDRPKDQGSVTIAVIPSLRLDFCTSPKRRVRRFQPQTTTPPHDKGVKAQGSGRRRSRPEAQGCAEPDGAGLPRGCLPL